jgi:putative membrane protein
MGNALASFGGFDDFLLYFGMSLALFAVFAAIYVRVTPYREIALIREGNMAAAYSLSGSLLGFIVPLASAVEYSVGIIDLAIWGAIALAVQIAAYIVLKLMMPSITRGIPDGNVALGFFLGAISLGVGLLNSACMSY